MKNFLNKALPSATQMIRSDHTLVNGLFHKYKMREGESPEKKKIIVDKACTELEIHATVEEEIFYPAMREHAIAPELVDKSFPEHEAIKTQIERLRSLSPHDVSYDSAFQELMKNVLHHVADEESLILPEAEKRLNNQLETLGARMMQRKLQLRGMHAKSAAERYVQNAEHYVKARPLSSVGIALAAGLFVSLSMKLLSIRDNKIVRR